MRQFAPLSCIRAIIQRIFSPPESTLTFFSTSSPENSIRPRKLFIYTSFPSPNWLNQSTKFRSVLKKSEYKKGSDKEADDALARINAVNAFLRQGLDEKSTFEETLQALYKVVA